MDVPTHGEHTMVFTAKTCVNNRPSSLKSGLSLRDYIFRHASKKGVQKRLKFKGRIKSPPEITRTQPKVVTRLALMELETSIQADIFRLRKCVPS